MYKYIFETGSEFSIDTSSFCKDFKEIKHENISLTSGGICMRSTYPNGFSVDVEEHADRIILRTNREFINDGNGRFSISK
jgi:hypothetical protein